MLMELSIVQCEKAYLKEKSIAIKLTSIRLVPTSGYFRVILHEVCTLPKKMQGTVIFVHSLFHLCLI